MSTEIITGIQSIDNLDPNLLQSYKIKAGINGPFEIFSMISGISRLNQDQIDALKQDIDKIYAQIYVNRLNKEIFKKLYLKFVVGIKRIAINENFYNEPTYAKYQEDGEGIIEGLGTSWALNVIEELGYSQRFLIESSIIFADYFPALEALNQIIERYEATNKLNNEDIEKIISIVEELALGRFSRTGNYRTCKNIQEIKSIKAIIEKLIDNILLEFFNGYYNGKNYIEKLPKSA